MIVTNIQEAASRLHYSLQARLIVRVLSCPEVKWDMLGNYYDIYPLSRRLLLVDFIGHFPASSNS